MRMLGPIRSGRFLNDQQQTGHNIAHMKVDHRSLCRISLHEMPMHELKKHFVSHLPKDTVPRALVLDPFDR